MNTADYIAIDTETGGLRPCVNPLLSIGAVCSWAPEAPLTLYVKPDPNLVIEPEAVAVNGYTWRLWNERGAVALGNAMDTLVTWLNARRAEKKRARLVAHHHAFDRGFLDEAAAQCDLELPGRYDWRCSMLLMGELMDEGLIPFGSASLARLGELSGQWPVGGRSAVHDVAEDAMACLRGYQWLQTVRPALNPTAKVLRHHTEAMQAAESALEGLMPLVVPGLGPYATPCYTAAVEAAGRVLGVKPAQLPKRFATQLFPR